jgi:hypothetical protein
VTDVKRPSLVAAAHLSAIGSIVARAYPAAPRYELLKVINDIADYLVTADAVQGQVLPDYEAAVDALASYVDQHDRTVTTPRCACHRCLQARAALARLRGES